jgi:hypothetical protein
MAKPTITSASSRRAAIEIPTVDDACDVIHPASCAPQYPSLMSCLRRQSAWRTSAAKRLARSSRLPCAASSPCRDSGASGRRFPGRHRTAARRRPHLEPVPA